MKINFVDIVVVLLAIYAAFRGWRRGLFSQLFELGGGFLGLIAGVALGPHIASLVTQEAGLAGALISLGAVFVGLSLGQAIGYLLGHKFGSVVHRANLGGVDSGLGLGFGVVVTFVSFWLIGSLLINGPSRDLAKQLQSSRTLKMVNGILPEPPNVLAYLRQYLNTSGFPQVFAGLPPIGPPVKLPSSGVAQRAIAAADQSTVRVVAAACGGMQLGSGWVAAPGYVVTNAHVVAGAREGVKIQQQSGAAPKGRIVLFDPKIDIAIVYVPDGLSGAPLALHTQTLDRGTPGATLGYPGEAGGNLQTGRAAVQGRYDSAQGRDIYGRSAVTRDVYELRARVRQGDSGGPFALPSGAVGGVVFAASTTDSQVGYALTGAEVQDELSRGTARTTAVSTGACTH